MLDESDSMIPCPYNKSHMIQRSRMQTHLMKCTYTNGHPQQNVEPLAMKICKYNSNHHILAAEIKHHEDNCPDIGNLATFVFSKGKGSAIPYKPIDLPPPSENWDDDEYCSTYNPEEKAMREPVLRAAQGVPKAERKNFRFRERARLTRLREQGNTEAITEQVSKLSPKPVPVTSCEMHAFAPGPLRPPKAASTLGMGRGGFNQNTQEQDGPRPGTGMGRALTSKGMSNIGNVPSMKPLVAPGVGAIHPMKPRPENGAQAHLNVASSSECVSSKNSVEDAEGFTKVEKKKKKGNSVTPAENQMPVAISPLHPYGVPIPASFPKILAPSQQSGKGRGRLPKK